MSGAFANINFYCSFNAKPQLLMGCLWWNYFQMANFNWLLTDRNIARQVVSGMLYTVQCLKKNTFAALRQSLRKVEPDSTSCNAFCNKKCCVALYDCGGMSHLAIFSIV